MLLHLPTDFARDIGGHTDCLFEAAGPHERLFFDPKRTRSAIVTCGGLCPGLNDVIRSIVLESHYAYGADDILGFRYGLAGFIEEKGFTPLVLRSYDISNIHHFGGTILGTSRGSQPIERVVDRLLKERIDILYFIGGDGSMKAAIAIKNEIAKRGLHISVIGIPKTIDNDINYVPKSFGFDTAVEKATEAIECAHAEAMGCHNTIGLVKLMGRESGFIAAQATLSMRDVNFVLVPELPFEIDEYTPIEEVNRLCEMVEDLPENIQEELSELQSYFGSIEELCEHEDDIICHSGCDDMADVARYYLEESGQLGELPAHLQNYIDYAAYGRDMELEGTFVVTNHGVYEILR